MILLSVGKPMIVFIALCFVSGSVLSYPGPLSLTLWSANGAISTVTDSCA